MLTWRVSRRGNKPEDEIVIRIPVILLKQILPVSLKWLKVYCCRQMISPNFCAGLKHPLQPKTVSCSFVILQQFHHGYPPHHITMCFICRHGILLPHFVPFLGRSLSWAKGENITQFQAVGLCRDFCWDRHGKRHIPSLA